MLFFSVATIQLYDNTYRYHDYNNYAGGNLLVYSSTRRRFEYVCDESWDKNDADVVCRMLGFPGALDAIVRSQYGRLSFYNNFHYVTFSNFQCNGTEKSIFDCPYDSNVSCSAQRIAGVRCIGKLK